MLITPFRGFEDLDLKASGQASRGAVGRETQIHIQYKMKKRGHLYRGQRKNIVDGPHYQGQCALLVASTRYEGVNTHTLDKMVFTGISIYVYIYIYDYCKYI